MKRPIVRLAVQVTIVVALLAAAVLVLGPVRIELERRFEEVKNQAVGELEGLLGRRITYTGVSPSILRYLSISDLTIHGTADEPADLLTVGQLRIYYRPIQVLQGRYTEAISEIRIESTTLTADMRMDSDLAALAADILGSAGGAGGASVATILPNDLVVSGRSIQLRLRSELGVLEMDRLFFTTSLANEVVSVRGQGDIRLTDTAESFPLRNVSGRVEAAGTINAESGDTLLEVSLAELTSDVATVRNQVLQVRFSEGVMEARNVQDRDPIDLYARYIDEDGELYARILADGYRLSNLVELEGEYAELNPYLSLPFRGQANTTVTPNALSFGGSLRTQIEGLAQLPDGDLTLRFDGDTRGVSIDALTYATALGTARYEGTVQLAPLRPDGILTVRNLVYGGIAPLSVTASLSSTPDSISVDARNFTYAGSRFRSLQGSLSLTETPSGAFTVELGRDTDSRLEVRTEHAQDGSLRRAQIDARRVHPGRLVEIQEAVLPAAELPDISFLPDTMVVDTRLFVDLTDGLEIDAPLVYAFDPARDDDHVGFSLTYGNGRVAVRDLTASYQGYEGSGDFIAEIGRGGAVSFSSDVVVEDVAYEFSGRYEPDNSFEISGLHDVDARFYFGERGELVFRARGDIPLPIESTEESRLAFAGDGYVFSQDDWSVDVERLVATGLPYATVPAATVSLAGTFSPSGARLPSVGYTDAYSELSGNGEISWDLDALTGNVVLALTGAEPSATGEEQPLPRESYEISASYRDEALEADARFTALPLLRVGVETVRGAVSGSLALSGPLAAPSASISAELVNGKFNADPVELAATVELEPEAITIAQASGRYVRTRADDVSGLLSLEDGTVVVSGALVQPALEGDSRVGVQASGSFAEIDALADVLGSDFTGTVNLTGLPVQEDLPEDWSFRVTREGGTLGATGGPQDALALTVREDGSFRTKVGAPLPLRFDGIGFLEAGRVEMDLTNVWSDVGRLWTLTYSPDFLLTGGTATGSVRIVGPVNDPDFYGTLVAEDVTGSLSIIPEQMGPARTFLVFDEKILTVREATVPTGNGRARVGVEAILDRWLPTQYQVSIQTEKGSPVPVANDFGGVAVNGLVEGGVTVTGEGGAVLVTGDITATSTEITLSERPEEPIAASDSADTRIDLTVRTGRGVQFLWPTGAFPILRGFADVGEAIRITYESAAPSYSVTGEVEIQGGEVFYFDRSFYIREGRITFEEDEREFDPLLTVNAEIREVADEGPVEIYLVSEERPLSEFTPRWRSDPPLSEAAILALLGGNVFVSETGDPINIEEAVLLGSDVLSQFGIIRGFESSVREALQLDLFSIRTQLFQNLLRPVITGEPEFAEGDYPLDNQAPSLGQYLDNTTLFMGKYLGTDLFLELLVQLRASEPSPLEPRSLAGIEMDSEVSLEWQTPFFLLDWTFFPRDPSTLFLADNTISFSWEYSY